MSCSVRLPVAPCVSGPSAGLKAPSAAAGTDRLTPTIPQASVAWVSLGTPISRLQGHRRMRQAISKGELHRRHTSGPLSLVVTRRILLAAGVATLEGALCPGVAGIDASGQPRGCAWITRSSGAEATAASEAGEDVLDAFRWLGVAADRMGVGTTGARRGLVERGQAIFLVELYVEQPSVVLVRRVVPDARSCLEVEIEQFAVVGGLAGLPRHRQRRHEACSGDPEEVGVLVHVDA
mmetsp:Transcript_38787/g.103473  ORF Transcript_38787/g.103473 Transcript_38787/m.103473 type:complete len:236 (+) Transcript_38787:163-870(+)